ncbi:MAG: oxygenase MpaB family protein [Alphaproteobacteria bacterium]
MSLERPSRPVRSSDLEAGLARAVAGAPSPVIGLFGPDNPIWQVQREALVFLGAGRAMLLQTAHPWVAQGVLRQSRALRDPIGRFHRTFTMMFSMVYGSTDQACARARQLHRIHSAIAGPMDETVGPFVAGSPYRANDVDALLWVHATLWDSSVRMHEAVMGPMDPAFREAYYAQTRRFAGLFGIPDEAVPQDWGAFQDYVEDMLSSDILSIGTAGHTIGQALMAGRGASWWPGTPYWFRCLTAESLPLRLREGFGLAFGPREEARAALAWRRIHRLYPRLPQRLRQVPVYREALGRIEGRRGPDPLTRLLNLAWIGRTSLVP